MNSSISLVLPTHLLLISEINLNPGALNVFSRYDISSCRSMNSDIIIIIIIVLTMTYLCGSGAVIDFDYIGIICVIACISWSEKVRYKKGISNFNLVKKMEITP